MNNKSNDDGANNVLTIDRKRSLEADHQIFQSDGFVVSRVVVNASIDVLKQQLQQQPAKDGHAYFYPVPCRGEPASSYSSN